MLAGWLACTQVIDERRALSAQLAGALASPQALAGGASSAIDELTNLLAKNVLKEHQRHWDVGESPWGRRGWGVHGGGCGMGDGWTCVRRAGRGRGAGV